MIFKEGDAWIGVALEFNIVVSGNDAKLVEIELNEAVIGYLESLRAMSGFRDTSINQLLNQRAEEEYEQRWSDAVQRKAENTGGVISPLSDVYKAGISSLAIA